jgi:transposase
MKTLSFPRLPPTAQEDLRRKAVQAVLDGGEVKATSKLFGVTCQSLHRWLRAYHEGGENALLVRKKGKPKNKLLPWRSTQRQPKIVKRFFQAKNVLYATV